MLIQLFGHLRSYSLCCCCLWSLLLTVFSVFASAVRCHHPLLCIWSQLLLLLTARRCCLEPLFWLFLPHRLNHMPPLACNVFLSCSKYLVNSVLVTLLFPISGMWSGARLPDNDTYCGDINAGSKGRLLRDIPAGVNKHRLAYYQVSWARDDYLHHPFDAQQTTHTSGR